MAGHNIAVATSHVSDGCSLAMTFGQVGTCSTSVVFVKAEAMGPAVKHLGAVIGRDRAVCRDSSQRSRRWYGAGSCHGDGIGTVEAGLASGEASKALFVCHIEYRLELSHGLGGSSVGKPGVTHMGEHACCFEKEMNEVDGDGI